MSLVPVAVFVSEYKNFCLMPGMYIFYAIFRSGLMSVLGVSYFFRVSTVQYATAANNLLFGPRLGGL